MFNKAMKKRNPSSQFEWFVVVLWIMGGLIVFEVGMIPSYQLATSNIFASVPVKIIAFIATMSIFYSLFLAGGICFSLLLAAFIGQIRTESWVRIIRRGVFIAMIVFAPVGISVWKLMT